MWVSIDLCIVPIGVGVSLAPYIAACQKIVEKEGLAFQLGPNGTAIEGEWNAVFDCVKECHQEVHRLGAIRIYTVIKANTRSDRRESFKEKVQRVESVD